MRDLGRCREIQADIRRGCVRGGGTPHGPLAHGAWSMAWPMPSPDHMRASGREEHRAQLTRRVLVPMHRAEQPQGDARHGKLRLAARSRPGSTGAWVVGRGAWVVGRGSWGSSGF